RKLSKQVIAGALLEVTLALVLVVFGGIGAAFAQTKSNVTATDEQVSFTATGTGTITGVTHLPGGLTQLNVNTSGSATHLGNFTGPLTCLQDNQGTLAALRSSSALMGKTACSFTSAGVLSVRKTSACSLPWVSTP